MSEGIWWTESIKKTKCIVWGPTPVSLPRILTQSPAAALGSPFPPRSVTLNILVLTCLTWLHNKLFGNNPD